MVKSKFLKELKKEKISVVLSGGTVYGLAHIGVLGFLEKKSIQIDEILGSSMGAIIAAFYATGKNSKELEKIVKTSKFKRVLVASSRRLTKKVETFLKEHFEDRKMKDVSIPLKIMTTDLKTGKDKLFTSKDDVLISDVLMASIAIPGIFNPKTIKSKQYIDGGVHSNLPIECAKSRNVKIGCNVVNKHKVYTEISRKFIIFPNLIRKIHELEYTVHYLLETQTDAKLPYVKKLILIEPEMEKFSQFSFKNWKKVIEKGYSSSENRFEKENFTKIKNL